VTSIRGALTTRGSAFLAAGLTLLVGGLLLGFTDITRVGVLLCSLPVLAGLNAKRNSNSVVVTRTVKPTRLVVDQTAGVAVVLKNISGRRTQLQLAEEHVDNRLGDRPRFIMPAMEPGDIRALNYQIRSQVRGRYQLGPLTLRKQDPYGLASITTTQPGTTDILVLPRIEILGRGRPRTHDVGAEGAIPHLVALHGEDDVAVRSYHDGDDLRRIHWPTTAHRSELMVRQEDPPARRRAVIVLDSRAAGHQGSGSMGSFEWAVTAVASIAAHLAEHRYILHLASSETTGEGPTTQPVEVDDVLASLAMAQLGPRQQFDDVLRWAHPLTSTGGLVIAVVTDQDEAALRLTAALRQPEGIGLLILLDTASFAQSRPGAASDHTLALADMVAAAGWSTCVVSSGMTVAQAWNVISARGADMVGTGR
jgi:uncharacterized protein (DUF58 family)